MDIHTVSPFDSLYALEEARGTKFQYKYVKKSDVTAVDRLFELAGHRDSVKSESDWKMVEEIVRFYSDRFPVEWREFVKTIPDIRQTRGRGGYSESGEIRYVGALPFRLERIIKAIFPNNEMNKEFIYSFVKRFKIFKVGGEQN